MNMLKYFREKQTGKFFLAYLVFIILNYVTCLAPIGASYCFSTNTILLSSLLAYYFTLLAVTVYSFIYFPKENVGGTIIANLGIMMTILFMVGYIILFIMYNLVDDIANTLNTNIVKTALLSFIPVFVISLILSIPVIKQQVAADKPRQFITTIKESEDEGDDTIDKINREGI